MFLRREFLTIEESQSAAVGTTEGGPAPDGSSAPTAEVDANTATSTDHEPSDSAATSPLETANDNEPPVDALSAE